MRQADQDPYLSLSRLMRQTARGQMTPAAVPGVVLDVKPVRVRAAGLDLDQEDLRLPARMLPEPPLAPGDGVLLLPAEDGQIYYLIDKFEQEVVL